MTVRELMEMLAGCDPDRRVLVTDDIDYKDAWTIVPEFYPPLRQGNTVFDDIPSTVPVVLICAD